MKVAVTATGRELTSEVDPRFGRAGWFLVVDTDGGELEVIDNTRGREASSGAGVQAAQRIASAGAEYLLTGHCGPNAFRALEAAGVKVVVGVGGTVEEAVAKLVGGDLNVAPGADVGGHHGQTGRRGR